MEIGGSDQISRTDENLNTDTHQAQPDQTWQPTEETERKIRPENVMKTLSKYNTIEAEKSVSETVSLVM